MQQRIFGRTGTLVSALGLGTWQMGGDEWGPADDDVSRSILRSALEQGVTLFDTADVYGLGHSEALLGAEIGADAGAIVVTKGGWDIYTDPPVVGGARRRYDRPYLERALAESARRLQRETIDVYMLHNPTRADLDGSDAGRWLVEIRDAGRARWVGASVGSLDDARAVLDLPIDVLELPFNVVRSWAREVFPLAHERGVAMIAREPLERGLLTGKYGADARFAEGDHRAQKGADWLAAALPHARNVADVASRVGAPEAAVAISYPLSYPQVSCVIAGARSIEQLSANIMATAFALPASERKYLES